MNKGPQFIELVAGERPDGQAVIERVHVEFQEDDTCKLIASPAFVKGLARGDSIKYDSEQGKFEIVKRSGNLAIRVFAREDIQQLCEDLTHVIEKMGGQLDFENDRVLVFSIHVSCGFGPIEKAIDSLIDESTSAWFYGNVYDSSDGTTPLNWWKDILKPQ